jgi:hypothetical protein
MMRAIYLTVASIIPTGMYGMPNWHAAEAYCEDSLLAKTVSCRDGDLTSGAKLLPRFRALMVTGCILRLPSQKQDQSGPQPGRSRRPIQNSARDLRFFR